MMYICATTIANIKDNSEEEAEAPTHHEEVKLEARYDELEELIQIAERHHTFVTSWMR